MTGSPSDPALFDVVVVGGAIAGAAMARALAEVPGTRVALVARDAAPVPAGEGFDARIYAISPGNAGFLASLGAWNGMDLSRVTPVTAMRIQGDRDPGALHFDAYRTGAAELAWIVEDSQLQAGLQRSLAGQRQLSRWAAGLVSMTPGPDAQDLTLDDGTRLRARLVVGADGARSPVRGMSGLGATEIPYGQSAVVANFRAARPRAGVAWQWFQGGPVLALLPLPAGHVSMVWSTAEAEAARLAALTPEALCAAVAEASRGALGELRLVTPPRIFPLRRLSVSRMVAPRVALVGDAAHVVHPLAGQGANLGLQDVRDLAGILVNREPGRDAGDPRLLRRYERARAEPVLAMQATVHGLHRLFGAPAAAAAPLRNAGMAALDRLPALKNLLVRHAMH